MPAAAQRLDQRDRRGLAVGLRLHQRAARLSAVCCAVTTSL
jgi:hypothetical protein